MNETSIITPAWVRGVRRRLLAFFDDRARDLPWRQTRDPYRIWVSEVMLQQTRVETVIPYYERWMTRFPTLDSLADAPTDDVLRAWQGLGYYSRARNLQQAALAVREHHRGEVPEAVEELRALPGVGEYTAGAIASIAWAAREPAIDGNAKRVLHRLLDRDRVPAAELRAIARRLVPASRPGDFNQALMELGATLCAPRSPRCPRCPLMDLCRARSAGTQSQRPAPGRRVTAPSFDLGTAVVVSGSAVLVARRPPRGLLAGLWEFPGRIVWKGESTRAAAARAARVCGVRVDARSGRSLGAIPHVFSHRRETYHVFRFDIPEPVGGLEGNACWRALNALSDHAMPAAQSRIVWLIDPPAGALEGRT